VAGAMAVGAIVAELTRHWYDVWQAGGEDASPNSLSGGATCAFHVGRTGGTRSFAIRKLCESGG
jgi:hypothetical protein